MLTAKPTFNQHRTSIIIGGRNETIHSGVLSWACWGSTVLWIYFGILTYYLQGKVDRAVNDLGFTLFGKVFHPCAI